MVILQQVEDTTFENATVPTMYLCTWSWNIIMYHNNIFSKKAQFHPLLFMSTIIELMCIACLPLSRVNSVLPILGRGGSMNGRAE